MNYKLTVCVIVFCLDSTQIVNKPVTLVKEIIN